MNSSGRRQQVDTSLRPTPALFVFLFFFTIFLGHVSLDQHSGASAVFVFRQQRHAAERLSARLARITFDVRVRLEVGAQVRPIGKRTRAVLTAERFLARVRADVSLQQPGPAERLSAQHALARKRVRADVHLEGAQRDVHLVAVFAAERLFGLLTDAVEFLVFRQSAVRRVRFVAILTLVTGGGSRRRLLPHGRRFDLRVRRVRLGAAVAVMTRSSGRQRG